MAPFKVRVQLFPQCRAGTSRKFMFDPSSPNPGGREKIKLISFLHFFVVPQGFYEGLKTFWSTTKKCENKNLTWFFSLFLGLGREGLRIQQYKQ